MSENIYIDELRRLADEIVQRFSSDDRAAFAGLKYEDQLIFQTYIGDIIKIPISEQDWNVESVVSFLENLSRVWFEAFDALREKVVSFSSGLAQDQSSTPTTSFVRNAYESLLWINLEQGNAVKAHEIFNTLQLPPAIWSSYEEMQRLMQSASNFELASLLLDISITESQNIPSKASEKLLNHLKSSILNLQITPRILQRFWSASHTSNKPYAAAILSPRPKSLLESVLSSLDPHWRSKMVLTLVSFARENRLALPDIAISNLHIPSMDLSILELFSLPRWLKNVITSLVTRKSHPSIISDDFNIMETLANYLDLHNPEDVNRSFHRSRMIKETQNVSSIIRLDMDQIRAHHIEIEELSFRFEFMIRRAWARYESRAKVDPTFITFPGPRLSDETLQEWSKEANWSLNVVSVVFVSGDHHRDPLHPNVDTFFVDTDFVRGSADCVILNQSLYGRNIDVEELEEMLRERFNSSSRAQWEDEPGLIYCSDMSSYLFRIARFLQGEGCRYRVDPVKLARVLNLI